MKGFSLLAAVIVLGFLITDAKADQLQDVKAQGTLRCGVLGNYPPFSSPDPKTREIEGYDVEFCRAVAKALGVKPELKLLSTDARIPELAQGRIDVLTAVLGYTEQRAEQIDYSNTYYVTRIMVMVPTNSPIKTLEDLAGKKVSAITSSTQSQYIVKLVPTSTTVTFQDPATTFLALQQGKVDAETASELALLQLEHNTPGQFRLLKQVVAIEKWGLGIRKGEPNLKAAVNKVLDDLEASGEGAKFFEKWFGPDTPYKLARAFKFGPIGPPILKPNN